MYYRKAACLVERSWGPGREGERDNIEITVTLRCANFHSRVDDRWPVVEEMWETKGQCGQIATDWPSTAIVHRNRHGD